MRRRRSTGSAASAGDAEIRERRASGSICPGPKPVAETPTAKREWTAGLKSSQDCSRNKERPMAKNGEGEILEWLGGQQGAMLSLLEELVNIDGGSYDKAGVDAVGARIRAFLEEPRDRLRDDRERDLWRRAARDRRRAVERRHHADGPSRHGVSQRRADAPPVPDRERPRLRAGRLRHEGGPGDECVRARGVQEVRRRAGAAGRAVHLGRGDRLARVPADHRGRGAARPRGVQLRARAGRAATW